MIAAGVGLVLLLGLGAVIFGVMRLTAPMVAEGDKFLNTLGSGSTGAAYAMASATLRAGQTQEDFARAVQAYGLDSFQSASWSNRKVTNDRGLLEGTASTKTGGSVPLTIEMIREEGTWKVLSIKGPQAGASSGPVIGTDPGETPRPAPVAPAAEEAARLALGSMLAFNDALQTKSFGAFHAGISKQWQEQITPAKLLEVFQSFIKVIPPAIFISFTLVATSCRVFPFGFRWQSVYLPSLCIQFFNIILNIIPMYIFDW